MNKNNLIRFAQSLIFLPLAAGTVSWGNIPKMNTTREAVRTVFIKKDNVDDVKNRQSSRLVSVSSGTEANQMIAFNLALAEKARNFRTKAEAINSYFLSRDMPLAGYGVKMIQEAEKNNLDWRLLPAISVRESTGGKYDCVKAKNNPFGWGSCKISFNSIEEATETVAKNLGGNNPNTEKHYDNKSTKQILRAYNPPSIVPRYAEQVISIMNEIGNENLSLEAKSAPAGEKFYN